MDFMELAAQLGKAIREDERMKKFEEAKQAYTADSELQRKLMEYDVQHRALEGEMTKPERDTELVDLIQKRIEELYDEITTHPVFVKLNEAQTVVNELMNSVNATITANVTGETPSSCTHDCSTCGGCH